MRYILMRCESLFILVLLFNLCVSLKLPLGLYFGTFLSASKIVLLYIYLLGLRFKSILSKLWLQSLWNSFDTTMKTHAAVSLLCILNSLFIPISLLHISDSLNMKTHTEAHLISCDLVYWYNEDGWRREKRKK